MSTDDRGSLFLSHPVVSVCDFGTLVAESRVWNGANRSVSLLCLASTRPEERTVWGFWGSPESGCHWELSAGHKPEYRMIFGLFRCTVFRLRAHLAALCCLIPFFLLATACCRSAWECFTSLKCPELLLYTPKYISGLSVHLNIHLAERGSPQTWTWTLQRCRKRPPVWWSCCPLQSKRPPWRTPPWPGSAGTPETGWQGGCSPRSSGTGGGWISTQWNHLGLH